MPTDKILWVVNYNTLNDFLNRAVAVGATGVAIRTDNDCAAAIKAFHARQIKVYAWRWPSARRDAAMKQAQTAIDLYGLGLDGYFVDPEQDRGKPWDWDQPGLSNLANDFCSAITTAAPGKPFGVTSHYRAKAVYPKIPWSTFFGFATVFLPQAYWRSSGGVIGHGIPQDNYDQSIDFWVKSGATKGNIVPMAGELASVTGAEISAYGAAAKAKGINELHFYAYETIVSTGVWNAIASL